MSLRAEEVLAIAEQYTNETVEGGGAIKGKNCTIDSIEPISGGQRVTFKWTLDDGTEQTTTMDVMNGQDGKGIKSVAINEESHLIITYTDDTTYDAGQIQVTAAVDSVNGKTGEVTLDASDVGAYSTSEVDTALADKLGYKTTTETNADNVTENGIYIVNTSAMSNLPTTDVSMGYLLEVRRYGAFAGAIVEQIAYRGNPTTESPMYMRRWFANAWTSWVAIAKKDDIATKADKVSGATNGNFAGLDASGNLTDSGKKASDFVTPSEMGRQLPLVNLGTEYTAELKADISSGKFEKAVVGGYLTINGHVYYFAHPDYWLHTGNPECTTHHMLVVPAGNIGTGKMNDTNITTGAYAGSDMKTGNNSNTALATARAQIIADFGASNILTHRELFANTVTDGITSDWAWVNSDIDLMNEVMVYGCNVWASSPGYETGIDKCQIKLFQERPDLITTRASYWLRSVVSASYFAVARDYGHGGNHAASNVVGVRPVFAII